MESTTPIDKDLVTDRMFTFTVNVEAYERMKRMSTDFTIGTGRHVGMGQVVRVALLRLFEDIDKGEEISWSEGQLS